MVVEIYQPGNSTPIYGNPMKKEYIKVRGNKALTEFGMRQHLNLGVDVRKQYKNLFKSVKNPRDVRVYSSSNRRSVMSATSHNIGLFRNLDNKKVKKMTFKNRHSKPLWFLPHKEKTELDTFELEQMTVPLIIKEPRFDRMFLPKMYKVCPAAKKQLESIFQGF
jgi:hypothetical protein